MWQASVGNVAAGSLFATLQSSGMSGSIFIPGIGWAVVIEAGLVFLLG
jgi:pyruvate/2-oxoacid:ferredoxin oxidoreductase alpha subunit